MQLNIMDSMRKLAKTVYYLALFSLLLYAVLFVAQMFIC